MNILKIKKMGFISESMIRNGGGYLSVIDKSDARNFRIVNYTLHAK